MAALIITPMRNSVVEHFPDAERTINRGTYFEGYIYMREAVSVDVDNVLGLLLFCVKSSGLPLQNPAYLTISQTTVRMGGALVGVNLSRSVLGTVGLLFIPRANGVGRSMELDIVGDA